MIFGIIGAMQPEVSALLTSLEQREDVTQSGFTFHKGLIHGQPVVLMQSGLGKVSASVATTILIEYFKPDVVINTGSAGGLDPSLNIGDVVISEQVRHHDVDFRVFGFEMGQVYDMPPAYTADAQLIQAAKSAISSLTFTDADAGAENQHPVQSKTGLICTGEAFISEPETIANIKQFFPNVLAVEMEGAAIAQTCFLLKVPFVIIRSLSDIAGKENHVAFETYLVKASENSAKMVLAIIDKMAKT
jgi:adenosylhomocysteine nucleosidase